jgi:hypothetical protein
VTIIGNSTALGSPLTGNMPNCKATMDRADSIQLTARKSGLFFRSLNYKLNILRGGPCEEFVYFYCCSAR